MAKPNNKFLEKLDVFPVYKKVYEAGLKGNDAIVFSIYLYYCLTENPSARIFTQKALASYLNMPRPTLVSILERLKTRGLLTQNAVVADVHPFLDKG